jgi:hypothetical protein
MTSDTDVLGKKYSPNYMVDKIMGMSYFCFGRERQVVFLFLLGCHIKYA